MTADGAQPVISREEIDAFDRDGAICLRGLFDRQWLERLAAGLEKNFADPGPDSTYYTPEGEPGGFYDDYCNWRRIDEYRDFVETRRPARSPGSSCGRTRADLSRACSGQGARHQGSHAMAPRPALLRRRRRPALLDLAAARPGAAIGLSGIRGRVAPLRHHVLPAPLQEPRELRSGVAGFETIPDIEAERDRHRILSWDLEPGDCIVFHMRTLHGAPPTTHLKTRRRGFSTRWLGDDAYFTVRPWKTSPPFREVDLEEGALMHHSSFPVVWHA